MLATANATNLTGRIIIQIWQDVTFIVHTLKGHLSYANLCNLAGSGWGECEQPEGITDADGDGYDDISYEVGYVAGAESGDLNLDGIDNVLDVVILVDNILNP